MNTEQRLRELLRSNRGKVARTIDENVVPSGQTRSAYATLSPMLTKLRHFYRERRLNLWLLSGNERHSGYPLKVAYAGHVAGKNYFLHAAFGDGRVDVQHSRIWAWNAGNFGGSRYHSSDLVVMEAGEAQSADSGGKMGFFVPNWFEAIIDVATLEQRLARSRNLKNDLRKIRKSRFDYRLSRKRNDFDNFYHRMYLPHISKAHGDQALPMSYQNMLSNIEFCELLLVTRDGKDVAGAILRYSGDQAHAWKLGVREGDKKLIHDGALSAVYYFQLSHLKGAGFQQIHCGSTRAFLNDGIFQYKRKWGMQLEQILQDRFRIDMRQPTNGVKAFLRNNPFIYQRGGSIRAAVFLESDEESREEAIAIFDRNQRIVGIDYLDLYNVQDQALITSKELGPGK